ncbi:hypothetical protein BFP76_02055 [Amylibacter kogurei]|uniref:Uncharacterized protein n=1 Tax=Paramylibacter kogurei TaxID=1889778 RepID=A0A2G5K835_9RHOB|nr:hypothetical protein BFP76_02055 [Amylibacter kogurei]
MVETVDINVKWHGGFAVSQKQKNIAEIHRKAAEMGISPILEISTKSEQEVGRRLSAFNLKIEVHGDMKPLESVYQSSKVFSISGQHEFLMDTDPFQAKREIRNLGKGEIIAFNFMGKDFPTTPLNAFYDWLYIRAIAPHETWVRQNMKYAAYSDVEFTPSKSINCQARAVAEFHALSMRGEAVKCAENFDSFRTLLQWSQKDDDHL